MSKVRIASAVFSVAMMNPYSTVVASSDASIPAIMNGEQL
jgi:uncharacterized ion transporter superfamily protein YfcC